MGPIVVGIGGSKSSAGKTTLACMLLRRLKGWGAVKYTRTLLCSSIVDNPDILRQRGKDTARLLGAGAEDVLWVQSPPHEIAEFVPMAIERLCHLRGIIIEGNSAIEVLRPDIVIFICRDASGFKPSAKNVLKMADVVLGPCAVCKRKDCASRAYSGQKAVQREDCINFVMGLIDEYEAKRNAKGKVR